MVRDQNLSKHVRYCVDKALEAVFHNRPRETPLYRSNSEYQGDNVVRSRSCKALLQGQKDQHHKVEEDGLYVMGDTKV